MPRVHTQKANKDYPQHGIKKGDTYYKWSFRYGGTHMSKTPPKPSQLTQSKMSGAYAAGEGMEEAVGNASTIDDIVDAMDTAIDAIREVATKYEEASQAETGNGNRVPNADEMEEKAQNLNDWADSIESDKGEVEGLDVADFIDEGLSVEDMDDDIIEETEEQCEHCEGEGKVDSGDGEKIECDQCAGTGKVTKRARREVTEFDDLDGTEKDAMLEAAREAALQNSSCPI